MGAAADPKCILHCALTSTQRPSKPASSSATTLDDRRPTDLKKPCRFGRTLTKSSLLTTCVPCGPANTNDSPRPRAAAADSASWPLQSACCRSAKRRSWRNRLISDLFALERGACGRELFVDPGRGDGGGFEIAGSRGVFHD